MNRGRGGGFDRGGGKVAGRGDYSGYEEADLIVVMEEEEVQEVVILVIRVVVHVILAKTVREKMKLVTIVVQSDTLNSPM